MTTSFLIKATRVLVSGALVLAFSPLSAQDEVATEADLFYPIDASDENVVESGNLDELVIDSSKLDESLADTTVSIGRVAASRIEDSQLRDVRDTFRMMANVSEEFVIRGVRPDSPDATVATGIQAPLSVIFVDGVALTQQGARMGQTGLWDVQSVEVLRGPQSTLQGKNSLAGAVNIQTRDPIFDREGAIRTTFGNYGTAEWAAMLNAPVNDSVALRFTAEWAEKDNFISYPGLTGFPGYKDLVSSESLLLRGKILVAPAGAPISSKLTWSYAERNPIGSGVFGPNADPRVTSFYDYIWYSESGNQQDRSVRNNSLAWENLYDISDTLRVTALTTFTRSELAVDEVDGDKVRDDIEQEWAQEVRLNWNESWGRAVLGVYGSELKVRSTHSDSERQWTNYALFGEADLRLTDHWNLIAGGRLSRDDYWYTSNVSSTDYTEDVFLPKFGLRYEFEAGHTLGFHAQKGYQTGGSGVDAGGTPYDFDPSHTNHFELAYRNSFLDGRLTVAANAFYSEWKDQQIVLRTFDSTTFSVDERVTNAAESTLWGSELELAWYPCEPLRFFSSIGFLSTRYDDFSYDIDPLIADLIGIPATQDFSGYEFPSSPDFNLSAGFDWRFKDGFFIAGDLTYTSSYYSPVLFAPLSTGVGGIAIRAPQNELVEIDPLTLVNLSAGYEGEEWRVVLFVENLFNTDHVTSKFPGARATGTGIEYTDNNLASVGTPRTYGVSVELRF